MAEMADTAALREENAKLRARLEALALQYDDVREEGKITTIYDNEKGVCIHVPDDKWYESVDEDNMATGELKEWFAAKGWHNVDFDDFTGSLRCAPILRPRMQATLSTSLGTSSSET